MQPKKSAPAPVSTPVKVLLADDSAFMLRTVVRLLRTSSQVELIGAAANLPDAARLAAKHKPHVFVLDLHMAQGVAADVLSLKTENGGTHLLAITAASLKDEAVLALAKAIGAERVLDKMSLDGELIPTILELASDQDSTVAPPSDLST